MEGARRDGKAEGKLEALIDTAISMLKKGFKPEDVAECTKLPLERVYKLQPQR